MNKAEGKKAYFKKRLLGNVFGIRIATSSLLVAGGTSLLLVGGVASRANAFQVYSADGWEVNLDTTVQYSNQFRIGGVSSQVSAKNINHSNYASPQDYNGNDGDLNFQHGLVSNQFEVIPVLSVHNGNFGLHLSGQAFINTVYLKSNQNSSAATQNYAVSNSQNFTRGTVATNGRFAQLLDAYLYDSVSFGQDQGQTLTVKVGRQTLLWGQSLFFTNNGIAAGQAPIDVNEALNLANPEAQQIFMPVGQAVVTYQPNNWLTLQGYYQFQWQPDLFPGAGSYLASADFASTGASKVVVGLIPTGPDSFTTAYFARGKDLTPPSQNGQFGMSAQFQIGNYDVGIYGLRFDNKSPQFYITPGVGTGASSQGVAIGGYNIAYARDIWIEGVSLSTTVGPVNVGGELSTRQHQDLFSTLVPLTGGVNENSNPGYAVGDTLNGQISAVYITPGLPLMPGGATILGEIEANRVMAVTSNKDELLPGRGPNGIGFEVQATPTYYAVLPHLDVTFPIGFTWYPSGRSEFSNSEQAGTGTLDIGISATYRSVWTASLSYKDYLGSTSYLPVTYSTKQALADRSYASFYIQRTF